MKLKGKSMVSILCLCMVVSLVVFILSSKVIITEAAVGEYLGCDQIKGCTGGVNCPGAGTVDKNTCKITCINGVLITCVKEEYEV